MNAADSVTGLLTEWSVIRVSGAERREFLQGQLTQDTFAVSPSRPLPTGWANAKGRLLFTGWLLDYDDALQLLLPAVLAEGVIRRLAMFRLRAAVTVEPAAHAVSATISAGVEKNSVTGWFNDEMEYRFSPGPGALLSLSTAAERATAAGAAPSAADTGWRSWCIRSGHGIVWPATQEKFVPQMLNLDRTGGISFTKGCYVGQEIVARTQNLGRIKRRMFRMQADGGNAVAGTDLFAGEQLAGVVVDAVPGPEGSELLAVLKLDCDRAALRLAAPDGQRVQILNLPYEVPELQAPA